MLCEGVANDWSALELKTILGAPASTAAFAYGTYAATMTIGRLLADRRRREAPRCGRRALVGGRCRVRRRRALRGPRKARRPGKGGARRVRRRRAIRRGLGRRPE